MDAIKISSHALQKMNERGIPEATVRAAVHYARPWYDRDGRRIHDVGPGLARRHISLMGWGFLRVVVAPCREVVTAYIVGLSDREKESA